jgi:quinol-cytochrome oxidoreductase complex cytochrome b subunit
MNIVAAQLGIDPDIWGTVVVMLLMLGALLFIPFLDRGKHAPSTSAEAFDWRKRGWAFLAMGLFWFLLIVGLVQNALTAEG